MYIVLKPVSRTFSSCMTKNLHTLNSNSPATTILLFASKNLTTLDTLYKENHAVSDRIEVRISERYLRFSCSWQHYYKQQMETTQMSINGLVNKNMVYTYNGILSSLKKEWNLVIRSNMANPWRNHAKWKRAVTEQQTKNGWKWKLLSHVRLFATPWTI